jgi:histone H3/H4
MAEMIISKTKTKEAVKECNVSGEFYDALDTKVRQLIAKAEERALANGRKTVRPQDL